MVNKYKGEVALQVRDETYILDLSFNAMCHLEDHFDKGIIEIGQMLSDMQSDPTKLRAKIIRAVLWGALIEHHPKITEKEAGCIVSSVGFAAVFSALTNALLAANPDAAEASGESPSPEAQADGTTRAS
ncbi:MAG TPA: hypothetical protein VGN60_01330 [Devosia sp.]|jgi:uncharacterized Fe-S cluster-containing protein|nr:hypothetical protein [Devosia sp.]